MGRSFLKVLGRARFYVVAPKPCSGVFIQGSFVIKIKGPEGWSWDPEQVPIVVDHTSCNANEDINFRFTGFTISGRVVGAVGGDSCSHKNGGPSNVNVELLSPSGDVVSSVLTTSIRSYSFTNIVPGLWLLCQFYGAFEHE